VQWFILVVLPTWENGSGRIMVPGQPWKKVHETPSGWKKLSVMVCTHHPSYSRKHKQDCGPSLSRQAKRAGGMVHVVKCLPNKHEDLN
jgi:hypothetical protein